jgi:excinuclease UvrABC ATPase subunit
MKHLLKDIGNLVIYSKCSFTQLSKIKTRLQYLINIGVGYLNLSREVGTLSGGEAQRVKLAKQLGSSLTEMIYILDEPSVGLHPRDVHLVNELLKDLKDAGNTVLVVEHDPDVIKIADHIIDIGPNAGSKGGKIVYQGNFASDRMGKIDSNKNIETCGRENKILQRFMSESGFKSLGISSFE